MSVKKFRAFHYVALAGGFSHAARELATSQSTLSAQVGQLEAHFGISLFDRSPRGVTMTPEGQALFELTTRLFDAEAEVRNFLHDGAGKSGGHLRVAADGPFLPLPILAGLKTSRKGLRISLTIDNSDQVIDSLLNYRADVGITAKRADDPRLHSHHFLTMNLGLCLPRGHELASCSTVSMKELAGRAFVIREKGSQTREVFERNIIQHRVEIGAIMEISTREAVREAVHSGFGIGVVGDREFGHDTRLVFVPISDASYSLHEYAVCLTERLRLPLIRDFFLNVNIWGKTETIEHKLPIAAE